MSNADICWRICEKEYGKGMYLGIDPEGLSFRSWNRYLLLGGGGHRTGENMQGGRYQKLRHTAQKDLSSESE